MGCPVVEAPCEAEAQCAALCKSGKVYASATEDMDCLTFATPVLLRKMTFAKDAKSEIQVRERREKDRGLRGKTEWGWWKTRARRKVGAEDGGYEPAPCYLRCWGIPVPPRSSPLWSCRAKRDHGN